MKQSKLDVCVKDGFADKLGLCFLGYFDLMSTEDVSVVRGH